MGGEKITKLFSFHVIQLLPTIVPDRSGIDTLEESKPSSLQRFCFLLNGSSVRIDSSELHSSSTEFYLNQGC